MPEPGRALRMPDLVQATRGFRHTVDSALRTLQRVGVADQVLLESAGPGWPAGTIVEQLPAPGEPLAAGTLIVLSVAGSGGFHRLPFALRTVSSTALEEPAFEGSSAGRGIRRSVGVDRVLAAIDDQVLKLIHQVHQAGGYLDLHPDRPQSALRWVRGIFDYAPDAWPRDRWYRLARLFGVLHRLAGRAEGIRLGFREVFDLEIAHLGPRSRLVPLPEDELTRLGRQATRLGVDTVAGRGIVTETGLEVVFRVPSAAAYRRRMQPEEVAQRLALYALLLPAFLDSGAVEERWRIGDPHQGARLGGSAGTTLGEGSYLGRATQTGATA